MSNMPEDLIPSLFPGADLRRIYDDMRLAELQYASTRNRDHNTCVLTLSFVRNGPPKITFRHRIGEHFGKEDLTLNEYMGLIHPMWLRFYNGVSEIVYNIIHEHPEWPTYPEACAVICIPIKKYDGSYHWYRQLGFPAHIDKETRILAAHINYYHDLGPYENHIPQPPTVHAKLPKSMGGEESLLSLQAIFYQRLPKLEPILTGFLSTANLETLTAFRKCMPETENAGPSIKQVHTALDSKLKEDSVRRRMNRLEESLVKTFGAAHVLAHPHHFARMLNNFFGATS